jgi:hypothetical protein
MRNRRALLVTAIALGLSVLPMARSVRADPPAAAPAAGSTPPAAAPAATNGKKKAPPSHPPPPAHTKPAKPPPAPKDTVPKHTPDPSAPTEAAKPHPGGAPSAGHEVVEHESRIEFDERMVRGQSAAGAIFLFQRTPSELKSIVEVPDTFRPKTVELLQPRGTP